MFPINEKAYQFELIENESSLFDNEVINVTYIIYLEGNGRYEYILKQIKQFKTTNKIFILHNKGFKTGLKDPFINKPPLDLFDAYLTCFKHASNNNYKNVLIFEDDFICDDKLLDKSITNDISKFIKSKENESCCYYLGVRPAVTSKAFGNHRTLFIGVGSHAIIYSDKFIKQILKNDLRNMTINTNHWDAFLIENSISFKLKKYMNDKCLVYQPFTETENSKFWGQEFGNLGPLAVENIFKLFKLFKFDKNQKFGHDLAYDICIKIPTLFL